MPIARRKKVIKILDKETNAIEAEFTISPLTFSEMETYADMQRQFSEDIESKKFKDDSKEAITRSRANVFFVICCGLNNAGMEPAVTAEQLPKEIDDVLATKLWRAILEFTGITLPTEEQIKEIMKRKAESKPEGEAQASS